MKPERHIWEENSTHRAVAGKEYDEVWDYAEQLEAKLYRLDVEMLTTDDEGNPVGCGMDLLDWQAHLQTELGIERLRTRELEAENEALGELLSPLVDVELERDKLKAENEALKEKEINDDVRWMQIVYFVEKLRMNAVEGGMIAGWLDQLDEILNAKPDALLTREKPETPISDVPITP